MSFEDEMEKAARDYAADLAGRGFEDVGLFRYDTPLDNREPFRRDHRTAFGWAVRYTSSADMDEKVLGDRLTAYRRNQGEPVAKFHDRSLTVFTGPEAPLTECYAWLTQRNLISGGVIADFAGEGAVPMYTAAWSPGPDTPGVRPENIPCVASVIMKRFPARRDSGSYPWQVGPHRMYHLIMTQDMPPLFRRGPEPTALTDR